MPEHNTPSASAQDYSKLYIPGAIIIAGALMAGALYFALAGTRAPAGGGPVAANVNIKDVKITDDDPYIGEKNAPVIIAYWSDYQCPYCKAVEVGGIPQIPIEPAIPKIISEYVNTGKVKIVFKDYPFLSEDSDTAALYGRAVWKLYQSKYYEWREAMYKAQDEEHGGFGNEASILELSGKIAGIDKNALKADVAANKDTYTERITADRAEGASFGINGTPGFITGETLIPGASEFPQFKAAIDAQL